MMGRRSQEHSTVLNTFLRNHTTSSHDETIDASLGTHLNDIHDSVQPKNDVSIINNTEELFQEQDEKENVEAESKIMLLSPIEEVLQVWKHCGVNLWSPLQDLMQTPIPSNQNFLTVAQLVLYTQTNSQYGTGLQELIEQNLQYKQAYCLLCLSVL
jgi:hypothetical protein